MGKALYRKYRPKKLSEIVGQEHITTALSNAIKTSKVSHAYLFTGPRGVGKTSIARILAHEINGLPYDEDATHLDIIEIDAASNRRIDEIRDLRERVHNAPAGAKYKVYIIDEVHMLTREAFNALLKTLEEPPAHAIFILATTEAHKLPETIVSRTQRYTFRPIEVQKVIDHLRVIAKTEKIEISDDALHLIAVHGDGSFRDSISLLDQIRNSDTDISLETVQRSLGIAPAEAIDGLLTALASYDTKAMLEALQAMQRQGYHAPQIARQLADRLRQNLLDNQSTLSAGSATALLRELLGVPAAHDPLKLLEIILLEATIPENEQAKVTRGEGRGASLKPVAEKPQSVKQPAAQTTPVLNDPKKPAVEEAVVTIAKPDNATESIIPKGSGKPKTAGKTTHEALDEQKWQEVLLAVKATHNTLYSVARMAVPTFTDGEVTLAFSFPFHQKRLNDVKNKQIISDIILETTGKPMTITCIVDTDARTVPAAITQPAEVDPSLENISNIFGPTEVIE